MLDRRVHTHPVLGPSPAGPEVTFYFNGEPFTGRAGEPIAAALAARGVLALRRHEADGSPRGVFCGIGHCFECRVTVNGVPGQRACLTPVTAGMQVAAGGPPAEGDHER